MDGATRRRVKWHLSRLRKTVVKERAGSLIRCQDYWVRINDGPNFYMLYKDLFAHRIYQFEAQRSDPVILDCGSNIGMSILFFKKLYPDARVLGFEPDPRIFPYLQENIALNRLQGVELFQAAVAAQEGSLTLYSDGKYGSFLGEGLPAEPTGGWVKYTVPCVRLRDYLNGPVDFLKLNIEGAEYSVLADSADRLRCVRELVLEYHHLPELPRTLHRILALLHDAGFEYLVNDFDGETNAGVRPPFCLTPETRYYLLVYARRLD